jgi:DNA invertase Pin-like site-specific DNA recombinase
MKKYYAYISPIHDFEGPALCMTAGDQLGAITTRLSKTPIEYVWDETHSLQTSPTSSSSSAGTQKEDELLAKRKALVLALAALRKGDVLVVYSTGNFLSGQATRRHRASRDVLSLVDIVHDLGASVYFLKEKLATATASGRMNLQIQLAAQQYHSDIGAEETAETLEIATMVKGC